MSAAGAATRSYGRAAGLLTIALAAAGLLTYGFFAVASHTLDPDRYGQIVVLWAVVFILVATLFRPVEQLLARTLAELDAQGRSRRHALRVGATIQFGFALAFVVAALALHGPIESRLLEGEELLFWVMIGSVLAFSASFFLRGFLAGSRQFTLYAALVVVDGTGRLGFALAAAVGVATGFDLIAIGIAIAPALSIGVALLAVRRARAAPAPASEPGAGPDGKSDPESAPAVSAEAVPEMTLAHGGGFAAAVLVIMLSEQAFLNGGPLITNALEGSAAAGFIFNVLMVARAPVVIFQAIAASLLPHLTRLRSRGRSGDEAFRASVRLTVLVILGLAALAVLVVLAAGPQLMEIAFGSAHTYDRLGLAIVAGGMGLYLSAATLNQAALAQGKARRAAACWAGCATAFVLWCLLPVLDVFRRVELGYAGGAALLCALLYMVYREPATRPGTELRPGSPEELEARLAAADEAA